MHELKQVLPLDMSHTTGILLWHFFRFTSCGLVFEINSIHVPNCGKYRSLLKKKFRQLCGAKSETEEFSETQGDTRLSATRQHNTRTRPVLPHRHQRKDNEIKIKIETKRNEKIKIFVDDSEAPSLLACPRRAHDVPTVDVTHVAFWANAAP